MPDLPRPRVPASRLSIGEALGLGWAALKANYGIMLASLLVYLALGLAIGLFQTVFERGIGMRGLLSLPLGLFITAPLNAGLSYFGLRCVRAEPVGVTHLFSGFSRYWTIVGIQALLTVVALAAALPAASIFLLAGGAAGLRGSGPWIVIFIAACLLFVILTLAIGLRFAPATLVPLDDRSLPRPGVMDSLGRSWDMTGGGNWARLFVLSLVLGLVMLACLLALILPAFFLGLPLAVTVWSAGYHLMAGHPGESPTQANQD